MDGPPRGLGLAAIERRAEAWAELHSRIGSHFSHAETCDRAGRYLAGLLERVERTNGWQPAEAIAGAGPQGVQGLLNAAAWDTGGDRAGTGGQAIRRDVDVDPLPRESCNLRGAMRHAPATTGWQHRRRGGQPHRAGLVLHQPASDEEQRLHRGYSAGAPTSSAASTRSGTTPGTCGQSHRAL
jgi:hypothetical protein